MKRAIATAKPLREAVCLEMQLRDAFKEIRYGKWEDKTLDFVKQHYWDDYIHWLAEPAWNAPTGGETSVEISDRALAVIAEIQRKYATGNVIVVSHKATIRIILCELLGIDLGRYRDRIDMPAGAVRFAWPLATGFGRSRLYGPGSAFPAGNLVVMRTSLPN